MKPHCLTQCSSYQVVISQKANEKKIAVMFHLYGLTVVKEPLEST